MTSLYIPKKYIVYLTNKSMIYLWKWNYGCNIFYSMNFAFWIPRTFMIYIRMQTCKFVHVKSKLVRTCIDFWDAYFKNDSDLNLIEFKKLVQVIQDKEPSAPTKLMHNLLFPFGGPNEKGWKTETFYSFNFANSTFQFIAEVRVPHFLDTTKGAIGKLNAIKSSQRLVLRWSCSFLMATRRPTVMGHIWLAGMEVESRDWDQCLVQKDCDIMEVDKVEKTIISFSFFLF